MTSCLQVQDVYNVLSDVSLLHFATGSDITMVMMQFAMLPEDVILEIFRFCSPEELCRAAMVCKLWRSIADQDSVWRSHCHPSWFSDSQSSSCKQLYLQWIHRKAEIYCHNGIVPWIEEDFVPESMADYGWPIKILMIGDSGSGKSAVLLKYIYPESTYPYIKRITQVMDCRMKHRIVDGFKVTCKIVSEVQNSASIILIYFLKISN